MMKVIKIILNILHTIYCIIYFCSLDLPFLAKWEWYWTILYYILTLPLFIWGMYRLSKELRKDWEDNEEKD